MAISVVIITKNEAHIIGNTLQSLHGLTDDIVIVDSGSTDATTDICKRYNAHIVETEWIGYGVNKNTGNAAAANDWILSLDADEAVDEELKQTLLQLSLLDEKTVYKMRRKNFFCGKRIRFGEWSRDENIRLFNRKHARWNDEAVHEHLVFSKDTNIVFIKGSLLHYTVKSIHEYLSKTVNYAKLSAQKYFDNNKKVTSFKLYTSPVFNFIQHYIMQLGFLDGSYGYLIARTTARYTYLKYYYLRQLYKQSINR